MKGWRKRYVWRYAVILLAGISLIAQQPNTPAQNPGISFSLEKETALGRQMASDLHRQTRVIEDLGVQQYVDSLGLRLAMEMPNATIPFTLSVIAGDPCPATHEPASLPGGYVVVPAALFIEARSEAEFAGMLAHSMEHTAQRHSTLPAMRDRIANPGKISLIFAGSSAGACSENTAIPIGFVAAQRSNEMEADALAIPAMARAGFVPRPWKVISKEFRLRKQRSLPRCPVEMSVLPR